MKSKRILLALAITSLFFAGCKKDIKMNGAGNLVPKTVDQDPALPSIFINGTQLHAQTFGHRDSAMVVFLHGGPGSDYRNGLNVKQLAENGYYVVFFDQRGSGLSKRQDENTYSIQLMLDDITAVIQHYRSSSTQKIFLFGHSWGAMLTAAYINQYPGRINGAIFAEAGGFTKDLLDEYGTSSRKLSLFSETTGDLMYPGQFLTGAKNQHEILDYKFALSSVFSYAPGNTEGIEGPSPFWRIGAVVLNSLVKIAEKDGFDFTTHLNQYHTKVLFLYGELNASYGLPFAQKEAAYFPHADIVKINGTGHEMIFFKWNKVYPVVLSYLNSLK